MWGGHRALFDHPKDCGGTISQYHEYIPTGTETKKTKQMIEKEVSSLNVLHLGKKANLCFSFPGRNGRILMIVQHLSPLAASNGEDQVFGAAGRRAEDLLPSVSFPSPIKIPTTP